MLTTACTLGTGLGFRLRLHTCVFRVCMYCAVCMMQYVFCPSFGLEARDICTFATSSQTISPKTLILTMASYVFGVSISQVGVERSLRPRSSTCNCAPVSVATANACRVAIAGVASRQVATAHTLQSLALFLANNPPAAPLHVDLNIFAMPSVCNVEASLIMAQCSLRSCNLVHLATVYL